ncbi:hypothetical protein VNO80_04582 [Phaseolus coccineus]|uniref:Uncharacterized protein n=1 Tax=Phaseolus coccineus TaxID=3886 RepID=A0AAN9RNU6_PHACN
MKDEILKFMQNMPSSFSAGQEQYFLQLIHSASGLYLFPFSPFSYSFSSLLFHFLPTIFFNFFIILDRFCILDVGN